MVFSFFQTPQIEGLPVRRRLNEAKEIDVERARATQVGYAENDVACAQDRR